MAQRSLNELQVVKSDLSGLQYAVPEMLLQKHHSLMSRVTVLQATGRFLNLATLSIMALIQQFSLLRWLVFVAASILIGSCSGVGLRLGNIELRRIEKTIAKNSGVLWEELYVQADLQISELPPNFGLLLMKNEKWIWTLLMVLLGAARFFGK